MSDYLSNTGPCSLFVLTSAECDWEVIIYMRFRLRPFPTFPTVSRLFNPRLNFLLTCPYCGSLSSSPSHLTLKLHYQLQCTRLFLEHFQVHS